MKFLIAGLGNIGAEYKNTRHNIGFMVLDELAKEKNVSFDQGRHVFIAEYKLKGKTIYLIKPTTYMNLSGKAVRYWLNELKIPVENLMVITDDIALPHGKLRLKPKGSSGGHNGLKNIEELLQTNQYARLRFGVGDEFSKGKQVDFVLGQFTPDQQPELELSIKKATDMVDSFCIQGIERTMNQYN